MNFLKIFGLVGYLPIIDVPFAPGGKIVIHNASYNGLMHACGALIVIGLLLYFGFLKFYHTHPLLGKVIIIVCIWWGLRQLIRWVKSLCDDPYTRTEPYNRG